MSKIIPKVIVYLVSIVLLAAQGVDYKSQEEIFNNFNDLSKIHYWNKYAQYFTKIYCIDSAVLKVKGISSDSIRKLQKQIAKSEAGTVLAVSMLNQYNFKKNKLLRESFLIKDNLTLAFNLKLFYDYYIFPSLVNAVNTQNKNKIVTVFNFTLFMLPVQDKYCWIYLQTIVADIAQIQRYRSIPTECILRIKSVINRYLELKSKIVLKQFNSDSIKTVLILQLLNTVLDKQLSASMTQIYSRQFEKYNIVFNENFKSLKHGNYILQISTSIDGIEYVAILKNKTGELLQIKNINKTNKAAIWKRFIYEGDNYGIICV